MCDKFTVFIFRKNGINHLYAEDFVKIGGHYYFDIVAGVMDVGPKEVVITSETDEVEDIEFPYRKIAFNHKGSTVIIEPKKTEVKSETTVTSKTDTCGITTGKDGKTKVYKYIYTADLDG